jgi:hypothetical protein
LTAQNGDLTYWRAANANSGTNESGSGAGEAKKIWLFIGFAK